ncbi:hypothetical protein LTR85_000955 [Meristemomyces frigidus]|nr:hypothetical protein LTR85_000955 [Meristemomyces frigidus]
MPFEFTGKPPALKGNANSFASFSAQNAAQSSSASFSPFGASGSFGASSSPWTAQAARSAAPSPSSSGKKSPGFGTLAYATATNAGVAQGADSKTEELVTTEKAALDAVPTDDLLMQALRRAVNGRRAVFGQVETAMDAVLGAFIEQTAAETSTGVALTSAQLSNELRAALDGNQLAKAFVGHLRRHVTGYGAQGGPGRDLPTPRPNEAATLFAKHGRTTFARGSPAFNSIRTKLSLALRAGDAVQVDAERDIEALAADMAEALGTGIRLPEAQHMLELAAGKDSFDAECGGFIDWALRMIHRVVHVDKLDTASPAELAKSGHATPKEDESGTSDAVKSPGHEAIDSTATGPEVAANVHAKHEPSPRIDVNEISFRFLDLPPELRLWVYREALAPGHIALHSNGNNHLTDENRHVTPAHLAPNLLRICKLVHKEAREILYSENTICINVACEHGCKPLISQAQVPDTALPRLKSVMLVFDTVHANNLVVDVLQLCDWRQLPGMTGLKQARICMMDRSDLVGRMNHKVALLEHVIERLPAGCKLTYGAQEEAEREHIRNILEQFKKSGRHTHTTR